MAGAGAPAAALGPLTKQPAPPAQLTVHASLGYAAGRVVCRLHRAAAPAPTSTAAPPDGLSEQAVATTGGGKSREQSVPAGGNPSSVRLAVARSSLHALGESLCHTAGDPEQLELVKSISLCLSTVLHAAEVSAGDHRAQIAIRLIHAIKGVVSQCVKDDAVIEAHMVSLATQLEEWAHISGAPGAGEADLDRDLNASQGEEGEQADELSAAMLRECAAMRHVAEQEGDSLAEAVHRRLSKRRKSQRGMSAMLWNLSIPLFVLLGSWFVARYRPWE